jgi:hypothetical protein
MRVVKKERFPNDPLVRSIDRPGIPSDQSQISLYYPEDTEWFLAHANDAPIDYAIRTANIKRRIYERASEPSNFWAKSLNHMLAGMLVNVNALVAFQQGSVRVGTPLSECLYAMKEPASEKTKRAIITEAVDRGLFRKTDASWNKKIQIIYPTPDQLRQFIKVQFLCYRWAKEEDIANCNKLMDKFPGLIEEIEKEDFTNWDSWETKGLLKS